jgi:hypothetical protein
MMEDGFLRFSDLFIGGLVLDLVANGVLFVTTAHTYVLVWPEMLIGVSYVPAACFTLLVAYQCRQMSTTIQFNLAVFAYLLSFGLSNCFYTIVHNRVYHEMTQMDIALTWAFNGLHIIPPTLMFIFRATIHRTLGLRWLARRMASDEVSWIQVQQLNQIYTVTDCCLTLSALGS